MPLCIILSGNYCAQDIVSELGRLPPSFLPVGQDPLYMRQAQLAGQLGAKILMTIPADFEINAWDEAQLTEMEISLVRSPPNISLHSAVQFILEAIQAKGPLILLHGDTLLEIDDNSVTDCVFVSETAEYYAWADVEESQEEGRTLRLKTSFGDGASTRKVACGLFTFTDALVFRQALKATTEFIDAVMEYSRHHSLKAVEAKKWYDFGNLSRMLQSRRDMLVSRAFNSIKCDGVKVFKTSKKQHKINAEIAWYEDLPPSLRMYTPHFLGVETSADNQIGYSLEYIYQPTLAELFVYGRLPRYAWRRILGSCVEFVEACRTHRPSEADCNAEQMRETFDTLIVSKCISRLESFLTSRGLTMESRITLNGVRTPRMKDVLDDLIAAIPPTNETTHTLMHGDFFFGNTFFSFRSGRVRVIDPRGEVQERKPTLWGDFRYDLAKLAHSVHGQYDFILCNRILHSSTAPTVYFLERCSDSVVRAACEDLASFSVGGVSCLSDEVRAIEALLFLSMLPLHSEQPDRQGALFANGLLIHRELTAG